MRSQRAFVLLAGALTAGVFPGLDAPCDAQERAARRASASSAAPRRASGVTRETAEALEAQLDRAVDRVSIPRAVRLLGRDGARGYRLPGYGMVFVLTPRALPGEGDALFALRAPKHRVHVRTRQVGPDDSELPQEIASIEHQVILLQHETEQQRRAAEEEMAQMADELRVRLGLPPEPRQPRPSQTGGPETPQAPALPPAPEQPEVVAPVRPLAPPLPPPWKNWFDAAAAADERSPEAVVADVREALIAVFESQPARLAGLPPAEFVTVAVDFERAGFLTAQARPERTLIIRGRAADIEARARGAIAPDELRRRLEVIEY